MPCNSDPDNIPAIAHYKINYKPWRYDNVIYGNIFWKYAALTPFYDSLLKLQKQYTTQEKARDAAQYDALVQLAQDEVNAIIDNYYSVATDVIRDPYVEDADEVEYVFSHDPLCNIVNCTGGTLLEVI